MIDRKTEIYSLWLMNMDNTIGLWLLVVCQDEVASNAAKGIIFQLVNPLSVFDLDHFLAFRLK